MATTGLNTSKLIIKDAGVVKQQPLLCVLFTKGRQFSLFAEVSITITTGNCVEKLSTAWCFAVIEEHSCLALAGLETLKNIAT